MPRSVASQNKTGYEHIVAGLNIKARRDIERLRRGPRRGRKERKLCDGVPRFSLALVSNFARLRLRGRVPEIDRAKDTLESVIRGLFLRHWISPRDAAIRCAVAVAVRQRIAIQIHAAKLRESRQRVSISSPPTRRTSCARRCRSSRRRPAWRWRMTGSRPGIGPHSSASPPASTIPRAGPEIRFRAGPWCDR